MQFTVKIQIITEQPGLRKVGSAVNASDAVAEGQDDKWKAEHLPLFASSSARLASFSDRALNRADV